MVHVPLVKKYLKILAAVVSAAVLWLGYRFVLFMRDDELRCDTATVTGDISAETFVSYAAAWPDLWKRKRRS